MAPEESQRDDLLRWAEGIVLALLSVPFVLMMTMIPVRWLTLGVTPEFDLGQWLGIGGVWGLISLWWLVVKVRPQTVQKIERVPMGITIGTILGIVYVTQLFFFTIQRPAFDFSGAWLLALACFLPVAILADRLRVLLSYRDARSGNQRS